MPPQLVDRWDLMSAFDETDLPAIVVVSGPGGAGKTTAVLQWLARQDHGTAAWVSLDPDDDAPRTFWSLVAASIREVRPGLVEETWALLDEPGADLATSTIPILINELLELDDQLVLVLDDFHHISSEAILEQVAFLVSRRPPLLTVVATSRRSLDLPLATWRAHRNLGEIGSHQLAFGEADTRRLVLSLVPDIDEETIVRLHAETEGWVTGLHLAVTTLNASDHRQRINAFLLDDALVQESDDVVDFLLDVSILDDLVPSACNAVSERVDAHEILVDLSRRNLFLTEIDLNEIDVPDRAWRAHALLREALATELRRRRPAAAIIQLHHRAATWALERGDWKAGVHHLRCADDPDGAASALETWWLAALNQGDFERFERDAGAIAPEVLDAHPDLWIGMAFAALNLGNLELARHRADRCESVAGELQIVGLALVRCHYHRHTGNVLAASEAARVAVDTFDHTTDDAGRAAAAAALGESLFWLDDDDAIAHLTVAVEASRTSGQHISAIAGHAYLAAWFALHGEADRAKTHIDQVRVIARPHGLDRRHHCAMAVFAEGTLAAQSGSFAEAELALEHAITLARHGREPLAQIAAWLSLTEIRERAGDRHGAEAAFSEAERVHRACIAPGGITNRLDSVYQIISDTPASSSRDALRESLTERELTMLRLLRSDLTQREIATHLFISFNTARTHTKAIYRKLGVASRAEALAAGAALGLL